MRIDYFCRLTVTDSKDRPLPAKALKRLDGFIDKTEDADFTLHMDTDMSEPLLGEHVRFVLREGGLFAQASLHEKSPVSDQDLTELTDYVRGQFLDGYGENRMEVRKRGKLYRITFADEVDGPYKAEAKRPKETPKKALPDRALRRFHNAVMEGDMAAVKTYVDAGRDINAVPKQIETFITVGPALMWAANCEHPHIAAYLLDNGADPHIRGKNAKSETDGPALFYAGPEIAKLLLEAGADPKAKNADGLTRLEQMANDLAWHETHYDPEDMMADFHREEIKTLKEKRAALQDLFAAYS